MALLVAIPLWSSLASGQPEEISDFRISDSLYLLTGAGCNVVVLVTHEGLLVVDSGERPSMTEKLLERIRQISDQLIRCLVFTHGHHALGADAFPASALVISHANTKDHIPRYRKTLSELFERSVEELRQKAARMEGDGDAELASVRTELKIREEQKALVERRADVLPQITFDTKMTIHLGGKTAELLFLGPGHTSGDILVHFPGEKVVHVGDLLFTNGWVPRLDGDAGCSSANWLKILERIGQMDVIRIIPGHGDITDQAGFRRASQAAVDYLTDLRAEVHERVARGDTLERIKAEMTLPQYRHMGMADTLLPWNIEGVYREILAAKKPKETET